MNSYIEPEITTPVKLCNPDGTLNPAAVGWSRRPLHTCNLSRHWFSKKRWNYWAIITDTHFFAASTSNRDYFGAISIQVGDLQSGVFQNKFTQSFMGRAVSMSETVEGRVTFDHPEMKVEEIVTTEKAVLSFESGNTSGSKLSAHFEVLFPPGHETLNVVIPWNRHMFQFTSKMNTLPASGIVRLDGEEIRFGGKDCFAVLDLGRGIWPRRFIWNWGAASGWQNGRLVGLNIGGKWTDKTGMNENGICVDGKLTKVMEDLVWKYDPTDYMKPWHMEAPVSGRINLDFTPVWERSGDLKWLFYHFVPFQMFGHYNGTVVTEAGEVVEIKNLLGWAEEVYGQW
jgi:hypothetical protein